MLCEIFFLEKIWFFLRSYMHKLIFYSANANKKGFLYMRRNIQSKKKQGEKRKKGFFWVPVQLAINKWSPTVESFYPDFSILNFFLLLSVRRNHGPPYWFFEPRKENKWILTKVYLISFLLASIKLGRMAWSTLAGLQFSLKSNFFNLDPFP